MAILNHRKRNQQRNAVIYSLDVRILSAVEAELASGDIVPVMTGGNVTGVDLQSIKSVLVECKRKKLPSKGQTPGLASSN